MSHEGRASLAAQSSNFTSHNSLGQISLLNSMMSQVGITFAYLADPVIIGLTVQIIPVASIERISFCTVFVVIVVVWFTVAPVLIVSLSQSFRDIQN